MQTPKTSRRKIVLALLLAFSAMAHGAEAKVPEATLPNKPAVTQQPTPFNLATPPAATLQSPPPGLATPPAATLQSTPPGLATQPAATAQPTPIDLALPTASAELKRVVRWVIASGDNAGLPFLLIDKVNAQVFAFNPAGQLQGTAPVLLGMARGDRLLAPNSAPMSAMPPQVRITPAGRFVSRLAKDSTGKELLVLDYEASISLHPVVNLTPKERRVERLNSATAEDNRVSFGCINAPTAFYASVVSPAFTSTKGIVYVLPETGPASELFGFLPDGAVVSGAAQQGSAPLNARAIQMVPAQDAAK